VLLTHGIDDLTPQVISEKLFGETEGSRRKQLLSIITSMKKSMDFLRLKAQRYDNLKSDFGKKNALVCIRAFKNLEDERKLMLAISKDKWHPLPEVSEKEIIFDSPQFKAKVYI